MRGVARHPIWNDSAPRHARQCHDHRLRRPLIDPFGRAILLSARVGDRPLHFRCVYCMSEDMTFLPKQDLLTLEELDRLCSVFVGKGVRKLLITGGEPLVRRDNHDAVPLLSRHLESGALEELTVTTNVSQLVRYAADSPPAA